MTWPVYLRVGTGDQVEVGTIEIPLTTERDAVAVSVAMPELRRRMADLLRAAADEISSDGEDK
ncbi:hypothetical protein ACFY19_20780 [Streptosporangium saharense]|uniref:hypothetical protein n=1 Tax=Streptosporangium saharense TaxID=1706840 RepID=UPI00368D0DB3